MPVKCNNKVSLIFLSRDTQMRRATWISCCKPEHDAMNFLTWYVTANSMLSVVIAGTWCKFTQLLFWHHFFVLLLLKLSSLSCENGEKPTHVFEDVARAGCFLVRVCELCVYLKVFRGGFCFAGEFCSLAFSFMLPNCPRCKTALMFVWFVA